MEQMNVALQIVVALGAYCPRVKVSTEEVLAAEAKKSGRHKRPLIGRGGYGANLKKHFDIKRWNERRA